MVKTYEPLHHKYRPTSFDELIGQDPITSTLKQALISIVFLQHIYFQGLEEQVKPLVQEFLQNL